MYWYKYIPTVIINHIKHTICFYTWYHHGWCSNSLQGIALVQAKMTKLNYIVSHQNHFKSWQALLQGAVGPGMRSGVVAFRENLEGATRWEVSQWFHADDCFQTSGRAQPPAHTTSLMALTLFLLTGKSWTNLDDIWKSCLGKCVGKTLKKKKHIFYLYVCIWI